MLPGTVRIKYLNMDWDESGNVTITREDTAMVIRLSVSEWNWLISAMQLVNMPIHPPVEQGQ